MLEKRGYRKKNDIKYTIKTSGFLRRRQKKRWNDGSVGPHSPAYDTCEWLGEGAGTRTEQGPGIDTNVIRAQRQNRFITTAARTAAP